VNAGDRHEELVTIYDERYAAEYPALYIAPWPRKHALNVTTLNRILAGLEPRTTSWLDIACGQAWHFSKVHGCARQVGLDASRAQLSRARRNAPHADFVCADMTRPPFVPASFDLVTSFWAAYCYLRNRESIVRLIDDAIRLVRPGGAIYWEVLLPMDLESFNSSRFAKSTGFAVTAQSHDYTEWCYHDTGGRHVMTSPPLELFIDLVAPRFQTIEATHDGAFMVHLIATGRHGEQ